MSESLTQMIDRMLRSTPNAWPPDTIRIIRKRAADLEAQLRIYRQKLENIIAFCDEREKDAREYNEYAEASAFHASLIEGRRLAKEACEEAAADEAE